MTTIGKLRIATQGDREIVIRRDFAAPRHLVFDAYTKPELVRRWLLGPPGWTMPVCEIDLRVGGKYRYEWRNQKGGAMAMGGVHREIVVPERLTATQIFDDDWTGGETIGTIVLAEAAGGTALTQTILYASAAARAAALATPMADGMEAGFMNLERLLAEPGVG